MTVLLSNWLDQHPVPDNMSWRKAAQHQHTFVLDDLTTIIARGLDLAAYRQIAQVVSSHRSKSIDLPVYYFARPDLGADFWMRGNFYNWKLSVSLRSPLIVDLGGLCHTSPPIEPDYTGDELCPVYFEGFPEDLIFGYYEQNPKQWSAQFADDHDFYTAMFLIMRALGAVKPIVWHTRESHRLELESRR